MCSHSFPVDVLTTVIPVFNGERYIAKTLQSVASQTSRPDRLIVLDNCSTDGTRRIVEQFTEIKCEWRQNEKNLGLFGNLNRALEFCAQTQYLHLLHADDLIKPDFYARCLGALENSPARSLAFCPAEFIDENGRTTSIERASSADVVDVTPNRFIGMRAELRPIYFPGVFLKTGGLPAPCKFRLDLAQLADQVFWAEWVSHSQGIVAISDALCQYRKHSGNDTSRNISSLQAWVTDEWKTMQLILPLLGATGFSAWLWRQKLRCIFAARSHVKIRQVQSASPDFADAIQIATRALVGSVPWMAGGWVVRLRAALS